MSYKTGETLPGFFVAAKGAETGNGYRKWGRFLPVKLGTNGVSEAFYKGALRPQSMVVSRAGRDFLIPAGDVGVALKSLRRR